MGLFSKIGDAFSSIWKGVKKVFSKIMKPIAKFLDSDIGKALMMAVSVFSMGSALLAGGKGFLAGEGFIGKFINGGKEFLNSLIGTKFETVGDKAATAAGEGATVAAQMGEQSAVNAGDVLTNSDPLAQPGITDTLQGAGEAARSAGQAPNIGDPNAVAKMVSPGGSGVAGTAPLTQGAKNVAEADKGWLSKAASAAMDFVKSDTGATVLGNTIAGVGQGMRDERYLEHDSRIERMFEDPSNAGMRQLNNHDYNTQAGGLLSRARESIRNSNQTQRQQYTPSIPFRKPATAGM